MTDKSPLASSSNETVRRSAPLFGERAMDVATGKPVWWDGHGWCYMEPDMATGLAGASNGGPPALLHSLSIRPQRIPLSYAQQRLWFIDRMEGASTEYNMPEALRLHGKLDANALRRAVNTIVERHESLRTHFAEMDGEPAQVIEPDMRIDVPVLDFSDLARVEQESAVSAAIRDEALQPFNLSSGPLLRMKLLKLGDEDHVLLRSMHHIVSDGWSMGVFNRELAVLYEAYRQGRPNPLKKLRVQYADFALWQREWLSKGTMDQGLAYWKYNLAGVPAEMELPNDRPRPAIQTFRANCFAAEMDFAQATSLKRLAQKNSATLYMTMLAAFGVLLWRYSGQRDVVVGSPIANRQDAQLEQLIGFFVNSLVMRLRVDPKSSFGKFLGETGRVAREAYRFQDVPFEKIVEELSPERSRNITPIFQVVFAVQNSPAVPQTFKGLKVNLVPNDEMMVRFDVEVHIWEAPEGITVFWLYNSDLFDAWRIEQMARHYLTLLQSAGCDDTLTLGYLPLLSEEERRQIVYGWNDTRSRDADGTYVHRLFERQVEQAPEKLALAYEDHQLSYYELNRRSNQLAHYLRELGVKPDGRVAICVERGPEMMVGLLAVLKAGGAYVPLDPTYPAERLQFMVQDSDPSLLLTQEHLRKDLRPWPATLPVLDLSNGLAWSNQPESNPDCVGTGLDAENLAYVIYTSGSTGKPKAAMNTHRGLSNLVAEQQRIFCVGLGTAVLQFSSLSFDAATFEWGMALAHGGRLILKRKNLLDGEQLLQTMEEQRVEVATLPPSSLAALPEAELKSLRTLVAAGEALKEDLIEKWGKQREMLNAYGPSEAAVMATVSDRLLCEASPSIGRPIGNVRAYILDERMEVQPVGVKGELFLGGTSLGRGYLGRAELTAERFVPDPLSLEGGERIYRTGDLARYRPDGTIEFLGRTDEQVKLRGYRIELEEIEAQLLEHEQVRDAAVIAREAVPGDKRLVAYCVVETDEGGRLKGLREELDAAWLSEWSLVLDEKYRQSDSRGDPPFNFLDWNSSYTGQPIPAKEMRQWADNAADRILALQPNSVWEIGCGTGLQVFRVAQQCVRYLATDVSQAALDLLRRQVRRPETNLQHVRLERRAAHEFDGISKDEKPDVVVLNSVVQYFPGVEYLMTVLRSATEAVMPRGAVFVGDVRNLPLLDVFHTSVQLEKASDSLSCEELKQQVRKKVQQEQELVIDPSFFSDLPQRIPGIRRVEINLKRGNAYNELARFRYDVVLHVGESSPYVECDWLSWAEQSLNLDRLREILRESRPPVLGITGIPNARVQRDVNSAEILRSSRCPATAGELRQCVTCAPNSGIEPDDIWFLAEQLDYRAEIRWCDREAGQCDVLLRKAHQDEGAEKAGVIFRGEGGGLKGLAAYANDPLQAKLLDGLLPELRRWLGCRLPDYMVPAAYVFMDALPLTPNGKLNRKALPMPEANAYSRNKYEAPQGETENMLAEIWMELLKIERVGRHDNFFALGGHSLMAVRVAARIRQRLGVTITIADLFERSTLSQLADHVLTMRLEQFDPEEIETLLKRMQS